MADIHVGAKVELRSHARRMTRNARVRWDIGVVTEVDAGRFTGRRELRVRWNGGRESWHPATHLKVLR